MSAFYRDVERALHEEWGAGWRCLGPRARNAERARRILFDLCGAEFREDIKAEAIIATIDAFVARATEEEG